MSTVQTRFAAGFAAAVLAVLAALIVYDHGRGNTIPNGVSVGGVDVGGMSPEAARQKLAQQYDAALKRPVVVERGTHRWTLTPAASRVSANLDAMVDEAAAKADSGNFLSRSVRRLTGGSVDSDLQPQITYSRASVRDLVVRVRGALDQPVRNASVHFAKNGTLQHTSAQAGYKVEDTRLSHVIDAALPDPHGKRAFHVPAGIVKPKITDRDVAKRYGTVVVVDRADYKLKLYKDLKLAKTYSVGLGQQGLETPSGLFTVRDKQVNPSWHVPTSSWTGSLAGRTIPPGPQDPIKSRWIGIVDGAGIHGVDPSEYGSIGQSASHGCVRMRIEDVDDLYPRVPYGSQIYIT